jgi:hypothetical protein
MSDLTHCDCGCIYADADCPNCNYQPLAVRIAKLEADLKKAKRALRKIADFSEADPVKYIQGVDAIALDTLAELEGEL